MKFRFTKAPTFTKAIIAAAVFAIAYLASTSRLPSCSDTTAVLNSGGECIARQSFLHTASGWLALICVVAAVALLALKHKDSILEPWAPVQRVHPPSPAPGGRLERSRQADQGPLAPAPVRSRASGFCGKCGTRIIAGDRFCQGCGIPMEIR